MLNTKQHSRTGDLSQNRNLREQSSDEGWLPETPSKSHGCVQGNASALGPYGTHMVTHTDTHTSDAQYVYVCADPRTIRYKHRFVSEHTKHITSWLLSCISSLFLCFFGFLFVYCSSSSKFQRSITFHVSITGDSSMAVLLSRSPPLCPTPSSHSRILSWSII